MCPGLQVIITSEVIHANVMIHRDGRTSHVLFLEVYQTTSIILGLK